MWNKPLIATVVAVLMMGIAGGYILATEPGRVAAGERALYAAALDVAQEVVDQIEPKVNLTVVSQCADGERRRTATLPADGLTTDALIALVDEGCMLAGNHADLDIAVPNLQGAEGPLTGKGFTEGRGKMDLTVQGLNVTVKVDATARAGLTRRPIATTAQAEFTGEGVKTAVLDQLRVATVEAAPRIQEALNPENPPAEVAVVVEPAPEPVEEPNVTAENPSVADLIPEPMVALPADIPVTPLAPSDVISEEKLSHFTSGMLNATVEEFEAWIRAHGKPGPFGECPECEMPFEVIPFHDPNQP